MVSRVESIGTGDNSFLLEYRAWGIFIKMRIIKQLKQKDLTDNLLKLKQ